MDNLAVLIHFSTNNEGSVALVCNYLPGLAVAALLGIVLNLVLPGRPPVPSDIDQSPMSDESYDELAHDFEQVEYDLRQGEAEPLG